MKILAVDQARHGGWSIYDYQKKELLEYGTFNYEPEKYDFSKAVLLIERLIADLIVEKEVCAIFFEDIQMQSNVVSFKRLAQLQGVLINLCEKNEYLYDLIMPSQWQGFCNARGRTTKEIKEKVKDLPVVAGKKKSKILSIQAVKNLYGVETENDNLADAIMIGHYVVHNVRIQGDLRS